AAIEDETSRGHELSGGEHRRQAVLGGEVEEARPMGDQEGIGRRHQPIGSLAGDGVKNVIEIARTPELVRLELDAEGGRPSLRLLEGRDAPGVVGIVDEGDTGKLGMDLSQQLEPLPVFIIDERDTRDVAAWARVTDDKADLVGERDVREPE